MTKIDPRIDAVRKTFDTINNHPTYGVEVHYKNDLPSEWYTLLEWEPEWLVDLVIEAIEQELGMTWDNAPSPETVVKPRIEGVELQIKKLETACARLENKENWLQRWWRSKGFFS